MNKTNSPKTLKMIRLASYVLLIFIVALAMNIYLKNQPGIAFAVETNGKLFGISTYPSNGFLQALNLAPGQRVSADLTVINEGQLDFSYDISANKDVGDDLLYEVLKLQITDTSGNLLYDGNLKDLSNVAMGEVGKGSNDVLNFTVELPQNAGNVYQGISDEVTFILNAKEHPPSIEGGGIVWDPPLEKPDVNVRQGKIIPVKFHIINKDGSFDTVKRGVDLIISGVSEGGQEVKYVFSIVDGTLDWESHGLNKPHYALLFDAEEHPVKQDTYYSATVTYGGQVLGETRFKSGH